MDNSTLQNTLDPIPEQLWRKIINEIGELPIKLRGIVIDEKTIKITIEILNQAEQKTLPQNSKNAIAEYTKEGLDKKLKVLLDSDTRRANIISDFLSTKGIVEIVQVKNKETGRIVKGTRLLDKWYW